MLTEMDVNVINANFFFVDIVGLSDPTSDTKTQVKKLKFLNESIASSKSFRSTPKDTKLVLPTGDGMAIGFLHEPELPLQLAIELHDKINNYNKGKIPQESVLVRIGIHGGPVFVVDDVNGNKNIWGPGIIIARRIMDMGKDGHILLSGRMSDDLRQLSDEYRQILHQLGPVILKHDVKIMVWSAYSDSKSRKKFGNPEPPFPTPAPPNEFLYSLVEVNLSIKDADKMLVHYKRLYEIQSIKNEPVSTVFHQIATDVDKTFEELHIKVYDEEGKDLQIPKITINKPDQKEFVTTFSKPLMPGEKRRYYLEYEVEEPERYFENIFLTDCEHFAVNIEYPQEIRDPVVYEVFTEKDEKVKIKPKPIVKVKDGHKLATWKRRHVFKGQSFRFEW